MGQVIGYSGAISLYPTPESLNNKVNEYFDKCLTKYIDKYGVEREIEAEPITYAGLARYLGFNSRSEMQAYADKRNDAFGVVMKQARLRLEERMEIRLLTSKDPRGAIFALKNNAGYKEVVEQTLTDANDKPIAFKWADNAKDVIDIQAKETEEKKTLPPMGGGGSSENSTEVAK